MEFFLNKNAGLMVENLVSVIQSNKDYLSTVDGAIGDGDHGINMNKGFTICGERLQGQAMDMSQSFSLLSNVLMMEIGGSMGPLYGTFFDGLASASEKAEKIDKNVFGKMLQQAYENLAELSGAKVGDKTLMDVLIPACEAYGAALGEGRNFRESVDAMRAAAESGKESTRDLVAKLGRASRLGERSRGVLDAGAASCNIILQSIGDTIIQLLK
jgi:dihydroxyacetone kinase-like protein